MGVVPTAPLPTYPDGFPPDVVATLERVTGLRFCANHPASGTEVIEEWGEHHLSTGEVILYTSADSVLQLAAHHDILSEPDLLAACAAARAAMTGEHAVGRVIARPFEGAPGAFRRTEGRKDFAVPPPGHSYLEDLQSAGVPVHAVGKVRDLFAGVGIDEYHPGATNERGIAAIGELLRELDGGLVFANLVETDQVYGHRHDVEGFHRALREIDGAVGEWLGLLRDEDLLVLTADHGVDPRAPHTDHTREHAPLLATFPGQDGHRHDGPLADVGASTLKWLTGREAAELPGSPFL
jgi:phosphopentomutase